MRQERCIAHFNGDQRQTGNILIVDDNEDICRILSDVLRAEDYTVGVAHDGASALNELRKKTYDLMVLDYRLFDMTGLEVLKKLKGTTLSLSTIMISAYGSDAVKVKARTLGVYDFLDKPFDVDTLLKVVKKALHKKAKAIGIKPKY
jgi:two-component system, NtrC family, response regulator HydG